MEMSGQLHVPAALHPGKEPNWTLWKKEKKNLPLPGIKPRPVTVPTELSRILSFFHLMVIIDQTSESGVCNLYERHHKHICIFCM
jgi:hypothetical protein